MEELMKKIKEVKAEIEEKFGRERASITVRMSGGINEPDKDDSRVGEFESHFPSDFEHYQGHYSGERYYSIFDNGDVRFNLEYIKAKSKAERCAELRRQLEELGCDDE
jgi:hypothetical protein